MTKPIVYLVGAGPGDSALITMRGYELIKTADCIIYDHLVNPELLRFKKEGCKVIYAGKSAGAHTLPQGEINKLLAKESRSHRCVVRLKGGDPFIFGRGAEEAIFLRKNKINFEIVPGVTSAIAVPAYAGIPLTERNRTSTVGFITGHEDPAKLESAIDWEALTKALGTMVFLMGLGNLEPIVKKLIACGRPKDTPAAVIRWGTTARQKTVAGTLGNIVNLSRRNKMSPPAIVVIGQTVALRGQLRWFEDKPLFGKRVIVTRAKTQAGRLSDELRRQGAEVVEIPAIRTTSLKADALLKKTFGRKEYDWIFFTSRNGAAEFSEFLKRSAGDVRMLGRAKVCAIGTETAKALEKIGVRADYVPQQFVAESVLRHFKNMKDKSRPSPKALILSAKKARDILPDGLKRLGFEVSVIGLYDTVLPKEGISILRKALSEGADFITFTSSSTVENLIKMAGKDYKNRLSKARLASIGPITTTTLEKFGLKADAEAKVYTIDGLIEAVRKESAK